MESTDYAVIGAGLAGASTAWHLAARGHQVTLLERTTPANELGSSHGSARIFRYAYEDEFYTRLLQRSEDGWAELARLSGRELITATGSVDYGAERDPAALAGVLAACGVEHELLGADEARRRWPQIAFDTEVLWHPGAGVIDAQETVMALVRAGAGHGARVETGWAARSVARDGSAFVITAEDGRTLRAGRVVVAAGGWLPRLLAALPLPEGFLGAMPHLEVRQEQAYHFPYAESPAEAPAMWPTFIHMRRGWTAYGLPGGRDAGFRGQKIAEFNGGKVLPSAADQDGVIDPENRRRVAEYVREYLPGLVPEPYAETTCLFTNTPTEDFVIDSAEGITVVSPCSGHGAKFAPVIGELAADVASSAGGVPARFRVAR
ncbi:FAD-dependent oxidoreductase [Sinomonas atrocyanea]|jgi:sarcosine oxidase|uniref:FAD-dependent oxidoreductase n=1 Tax=Sinomonas atrocyanea TaxID=37927 RepID=UPI00285E3340|nr:FAD-dependent oxidoreductase [Sinomonas atrocyanea]MDR6620280.1 sarcosine oxidase [Sinomonas atrocyanea]